MSRTTSSAVSPVSTTTMRRPWAASAASSCSTPKRANRSRCSTPITVAEGSDNTRANFGRLPLSPQPTSQTTSTTTRASSGGNLTGVSENVLHAVARALQLDDAERQHLFDLARAANAAPRTRRRSSSVGVRPSVQRVLDAMSGAPAWVHNDRLDFLAANRLGYALYSEFFTDPVRPANSARFMFLNSRSRDFYPDWEQIADNTVAILRGAAGRDPFDEKLTKLVGELSTRSEEFRSRWAAHNVRLHRTGVKYLHHPVVGDVELTYEGMELPADPGLMLFVYTAEPGTPSEDGLKLLASWAATQELAESAPAGSQARLRRSDG